MVAGGFTTPAMTFYGVIQSRAAGVAVGIIGEDYAGVLVSDCLAIHDGLDPLQQKC